MTLSPSGHNTSRMSLLLDLIILVMLIAFALALNGMRDTTSSTPSGTSSAELPTATDGSTPYPADYPPGKQTFEAIERQTQEAAALTPLPSGTIIWAFPPATRTLAPWRLTPLPSTPAGAGVIIDLPHEQSVGRLLGMTLTTKWYAEVGDRHYNVYAGAALDNEAQGMVYVTVFAASGPQLLDGGWYLTPTPAGSVRIVGAEGQRLILISTSGVTFYFDVPGQRFTDSLTAIVPTATTWPTPTP